MSTLLTCSRKYLAWLITVMIALGMFPSFNALTSRIFGPFPALSGWVGPINFLKLALPFLALFVALEWKRLASPGKWWTIGFLALGSIATVIAGRQCNTTPMHFREWAVITTGMLAAVAFALLELRKQRFILAAWVGILVLALVINYLSIDVLNLIHQTIFDPERVLDPKFFLLQGFYDIASFGKLLAWTPWILGLAFCLGGRKFGNRGAIVFVLINLVFLIFALRTTQRGPILGGVVALGVAAVHYARNRGNFRILLGFAATGLLMSVIAAWVLPSSIIETRIKPLLSSQWSHQDVQQDPSRASISQRSRIWAYAMDSIRENPLGRPCVDEAEYARRGIPTLSHSHNEFLEQTRTRGWLWGAFFTVFWILSWRIYWNRRDLIATVCLGGLTSIAVLSLVDHPWFVLNHSVIIGVFLVSGFFEVGLDQAKRER